MFLDANILIYAYDNKRGNKPDNCAKFIGRVMKGEQNATTSPFVINEVVSGAGEFHPRALSELDMNLSAHPAPIIQLMV